MRDSLSNVRFTNRDAQLPGSPDSYAVHVPIYTRYSRRKISTSIFFGAFRAYSIMISSAIYPITSVSVLLHVYPNKIHFCILSGTMISPAGILLSHTFAGILTYNHKRTWKRKNYFWLLLWLSVVPSEPMRKRRSSSFVMHRHVQAMQLLKFVSNPQLSRWKYWKIRDESRMNGH